MPERENNIASTPLWKNLSKNFLQRFYSWVFGNILSSPWEIIFISFFLGGKQGTERQSLVGEDHCRLTYNENWPFSVNEVNSYYNAQLSSQHFVFFSKYICSIYLCFFCQKLVRRSLPYNFQLVVGILY